MKKFLLILFVLLFTWLIMSFFTKTNAQDDFGINLKGNCLTWVWDWCLDVEKLLFPGMEIDATNKRRSVKTLVQDVAFWATYMVWTVLTIVIIYCGLMYIFAARWWNDTTKYRKWLIDAAIWALLVWWAYAIVRLIQYMAKW